MKKRNKLFCLLLAAALFLLAGCGRHPGMTFPTPGTQITESKEESIVLNDRQKQILREQGLPTDYSALDYNQKSAIVAIEEMLQYLEGKYSVEFQYEGYYAPGGGTEEHLTATCDKGEVTVYRSRSGDGYQYRDTYLDLVAVEYYEKALDHYLAAQLGEANVRVFAELSLTEEGATEENILGKTTASCTVFLAGDMSEDAFRGLVEGYGSWLADASKGHPTTTRFVWVTAEELKNVFLFNYADMSLSLKPIGALRCSIDSDGNVQIY